MMTFSGLPEKETKRFEQKRKVLMASVDSAAVGELEAGDDDSELS
jgi:hypothetical protein